MKAVFVHDHIFYPQATGNVLSSGGLPYVVWTRYLKHFESIHVIGRQSASGHVSESNAVLSSGPRVSFSFVPTPSSPLSKFTGTNSAKVVIRAALQSADVLIARTSRTAFLAIQIARETNMPYAIEVVGCAWDAYWNHGTLLGKLYAPFAFLTQRRVVRDSPFAIYVSRHFLQNRYPCLNGIIAHASNVHVSPAPSSVISQRLERTKATLHRPVFGTIGSLSCAYKGIRTALIALSRLRKDGMVFTYRILGTGDPEAWTVIASRLGIRDCVQFCGTLPSGLPVLNWLDGIDIYLQPSLQEGLPRTLIEAMSRGLPCIASTAGGIPELIDQSDLHPPGDENHLGKLVRRAVRDPNWRTAASIRNTTTSHSYTVDELSFRRDGFWSSFAVHANRTCMNRALG